MIRKIVSPYIRKRLIGYYKKQNRNAHLQNLSTAKNVGILWNPSDEASIETYELLRKVLKEKGIRTSGLAYIDSKREKETLATVYHSGFIRKKDVSWVGKPDNGEIDQFMALKYDIIIDLTIKKVVALQYILIHADSRLKVGWKANDYNFYDLDIDVSANPNCKYLMDQVIFYLEKIQDKSE